MFEVGRAKREILERLVVGDWTPTDLADELGKSTSAVYNHLNDLASRGVLSESQVPATTRPKTEYSIDDGFICYVSVLPGQYRERVLTLDRNNAVTVRIWNVPQPEFHPFLHAYWETLRSLAGVDIDRQLVAVAIYGSVARGNAGGNSDIHCLVVADGELAAARLTRSVGSVRVERSERKTRVLSDVHTVEELRAQREDRSGFLGAILDGCLVLYDPDGVLRSFDG